MKIKTMQGEMEHRKGRHYPMSATCARCGHPNASHSVKYGCDLCFRKLQSCAGFKPIRIEGAA